jgi:site-specific recombinase XerD
MTVTNGAIGGSIPPSSTTVSDSTAPPLAGGAADHEDGGIEPLRVAAADGSIRADNGSIATTNLTLAVQYGTWLSEVRHRSPATVDRYMQVYEAFDRWLGGQSFLTATKWQMEQFQTRPRVRRGAGTNGSASTQKQEVVALRGLYRWLHENGVLVENPTAQLYTPTVHNVQPKPIPDDVWRAIWTPGVLTDEAVLILGLGTLVGLRRKEIVTIEGGNVRDGLLSGFRRKGGGEHTVPWRSMIEIQAEHLPHLTGGWERFAALLGESATIDGPIIGGDPQEINKLLRTLAHRRRVPHVHPHMMRHSCATNLLRCGVPIHLVASMLNHSSIEITMRYVRATQDELNEWRTRRS